MICGMKKKILFTILFMLFAFNVFAAQLVCIKPGTEREGICDMYDIVSMHEDDVALIGPGYVDYLVVAIKGLTVSEIQTVLMLNTPEMRSKEVDGEIIESWYNDIAKTWYKIQIDPKYDYTIQDLTFADILVVGDEVSTTAAKLKAVNKVKHKVPLYIQNKQTVVLNP